MVYIRYNPNKPGDRDRAYGEFYLGIFFLVGSIGTVVYFVYSVISLCKEGLSPNIFVSSALLALMAVFDFLILTNQYDEEAKRDFAKPYFLFFISGSIDVAGIIAVVVSIYSLCHEGEGALLLICAIISIILVTLVAVLIYRRIMGLNRLKLFTLSDAPSRLGGDGRKTNPYRESIKQTNNDMGDFIFCHKCGKKMYADSMFCSSCGTKLR